jgi:hypothetical protein
MSGYRGTFVTGLLASLTASQVLLCAPAESAAEQTAAVDCEIRVTTRPDFLQLDAIAKSQRAAAGTYRFEILKHSSTGTSQNVQSGAFELIAERDAVLSTTLLDGSARGHYQARLILNSQEFGSVSCVSP